MVVVCDRFGQTQAKQDFERSRLQYDEAVRNKDYQLAQLGISLSAIEDKLASLPIVRSLTILLPK
ncbi:hypothetical protein FJR06_23720 [Dolichospermum sp. UHCC 0352]|uniref:hypothetical protein n=1 Tax=Dolichospermum sp. UHCC 0352 TaxID=2590011 RepID=UPI001444EEE4|nr:hypothetical protein [Dolichospermum sp. UHCC 0352]MTJ24155.1 hypothetical protein [Dolichospermum sp. UHCC 0352]